MLSEQRNSNLLRFVGVLYFLGGFSGASFGRFSTIFYLSPPRNFNAGQIGLIEAVGPPCALVGNTVFGWLADKLQRKKLVTLLTRIVTTATITAFLIPQLSCCFSSVMIVMGVTAFFSVGGGVLDAYTLDLLGQKRRGEYGKYRLWLAVSWGVGNVVMGLVAEHNFDYNFIGYCALNSLTVVLMGALLPARLVDEERRIAKRKADIAALANAAHLRTANGGGSLDGGGGGGDVVVGGYPWDGFDEWARFFRCYTAPFKQQQQRRPTESLYNPLHAPIHHLPIRMRLYRLLYVYCRVLPIRLSTE